MESQEPSNEFSMDSHSAGPSSKRDPGIQRGTARRRGVALVIVLSLLVLITVLIVAFFSSVTANLSSTQNYAHAVSAKQLADSAVNIVMAQIVQGASSSSTSTWTSQPGLIRTFTTNNGAPGNFYKLYSSGTMIVNGATFSGTAEAPVTTGSNAWNNEPALYTDLNSPVLVSDTSGNVIGTTGTYSARFPIIDGNYLVNGNTFSPQVPAYPPVTGATYLTYHNPALNTPAGTPDIAGFYVQSPPTSIYNGNAQQISSTNNPIPMPVQWIYVLQNGAFVVPQAGTSGTLANFSFAPTAMQPTATNPIVGRIAFWTDDETCKLNINTAAGDQALQYPASYSSGLTFGSFWDIPRADTGNERGAIVTTTFQFVPGLAMSQPVVNEFQRYPGHPSTVALNTVFPTFTRQDIANIVPRISGTNSSGSAGSQGGTVEIGTNATSAPIVLDSDRLYASVDELMFSGSMQSVTSGSARELNQLSVAPGTITRDKLEQSKFFLTASSRALDLNLFGQPRISIWPISSQLGSSGTTYGTAWDRLIAFCTTIGSGGNSKLYYIQRTNPALSGTTPGSPSASDYYSIPRNQQLYTYLENMTDQAYPGFATPSGGFPTFLLKYGNDRDQILTEIFDYIRCVNLTDLNALNGYTSTPAGSTPADLTPAGSPAIGSGLVAPLVIVSPPANAYAGGVLTKGFGRFPTLMEAALDFYVDSAAARTGTNMKAIFIPKLFNPMHGFSPPMEYIDETANFTGLWTVTVSGSTSSLNFPTTTVTNQILYAGNSEYNTRAWGGEQIFAEHFINTANTALNNWTFKTLGWSQPLAQYPFCSSTNGLGVKLSGTGFTFNGGTVAFTLAYHNQPTLQTFMLTFPPANWPVPLVSATNPGQYTAYPTGGVYNQRIANMNIGYAGTGSTAPYWQDLIDPNDTVKALEAVGPNFQTTPTAPYGDMRLVALETGTDTTSFWPHLLYSGTSYSNTPSAQVGSMAHGLRPGGLGSGGNGTQDDYPGCKTGQLIGPWSTNPNNPTSFTAYNSPAIAYGIMSVTGTMLTIQGTTGPRLFAGDWDNGIGYWPDGPYANKSDEGDIYYIPSGNNNIDQPYFQNGNLTMSPLYFSPNRQIASAVMFGSLPSGALRKIPWQSLLFHPDPTGYHPGLIAPQDHLLLDLFTMPVVEPYAISEPFSTAGRINMNCQIMPFGTSIVRETGLLSAFESTWIMAISGADITNANYKGVDPGMLRNYRLPIDGAATLTEFERRFAITSGTDPNYNRNFVTPSEICDIDLYPGGLPDTNPIAGTTTLIPDAAPYTSGTAKAQALLANFWANNFLTGNNSRDVPYNHLYPLLTTKSNTFTVHMRVQTLKQIPGIRSTAAAWQTWTEGTDQITGEYRGSTTIERYIDPNDSRFTSGAINPDMQSVDPAYRFRIVGVKQFVPE